MHAASPSNPACAQRFGQGNALRKTIFELIAAELLKSVPLPTPDPSVHQPSQHGSVHGPSFFRCASLNGFSYLTTHHALHWVTRVATSGLHFLLMRVVSEHLCNAQPPSLAGCAHVESFASRCAGQGRVSRNALRHLRLV